MALMRESREAIETASIFHSNLSMSKSVARPPRKRQANSSGAIETSLVVPDESTSSNAIGLQITVTSFITPATSAIASETAVNSQSNKLIKKSLTPYIIGAVASVSVLVVVTIAGVYVLQRRRMRGSRMKSQESVSSIVPYGVHNFNKATISEEHIRLDVLERSREKGTGNPPACSTGPSAKPGQCTTRETRFRAGVEASPPVAAVSMHQVAEIREEVERLKQSSGPYIHGAEESAQLAGVREEMQRLRYLISLQSADRMESSDRVSRTTSLPAYEY